MSAHRRDEYLQAARLAIDPGRVQLELDLTPGIALAEAIIADIDRNRDGVAVPDEQRAYGEPGAERADARGRWDAGARAAGRVQFSRRRSDAAWRRHHPASIDGDAPGPVSGRHQLLFRNRHHPDRSVYLANALVPASDQLPSRRSGATAISRADDRLCGPRGAGDVPGAWLLGSVAAAR